MSYKVFLRRKAIRSLKNLPSDIKDRVKQALFQLKDFPKNLDVLKIKGTKNKYRIRVGKYRIIIELQRDTIIVIDILPRKRAY